MWELFLRVRREGGVGTDGLLAEQLEAGDGAAEAGAHAREVSEAAAHG